MPTNGKGALEQEDNFLLFYYFLISVRIALLGFTRHFYLLIDLFYFKLVRLVCQEA